MTSPRSVRRATPSALDAIRYRLHALRRRASEIKYLNMADAPGVQFIARDEISESDRAYIPQL
jgi:hypothetical protein